jgi:hypothetical protein
MFAADAAALLAPTVITPPPLPIFLRRHFDEPVSIDISPFFHFHHCFAITPLCHAAAPLFFDYFQRCRLRWKAPATALSQHRQLAFRRQA